MTNGKNYKMDHFQIHFCVSLFIKDLSISDMKRQMVSKSLKDMQNGKNSDFNILT